MERLPLHRRSACRRRWAYPVAWPSRTYQVEEPAALKPEPSQTCALEVRTRMELYFCSDSYDNWKCLFSKFRCSKFMLKLQQKNKNEFMCFKKTHLATCNILSQHKFTTAVAAT
jgi:hypothetical protein